MKMWLAVNKDGTEICSNYPLDRYSDFVKAWNEEDRKKGFPEEQLFDETKEENYYWTNESFCDNSIYDGISAYNTVVELPQGTIKALTGFTLTWDDKPIEIGEPNNMIPIIIDEVEYWLKSCPDDYIKQDNPDTPCYISEDIAIDLKKYLIDKFV